MVKSSFVRMCGAKHSFNETRETDVPVALLYINYVNHSQDAGVRGGYVEHLSQT
jgi:hypothetical protein